MVVRRFHVARLVSYTPENDSGHYPATLQRNHAPEPESRSRAGITLPARNHVPEPES
jgi:hypothetical protein